MKDPLIGALLICPFQLYEQKIFLAIKSLTVDKNLHEAHISSNDLRMITRLDRRNIQRTLHQLKKLNVIFSRAGKRLRRRPETLEELDAAKNILAINCEFQTWKNYPVDNFDPMASLQTQGVASLQTQGGSVSTDAGRSVSRDAAGSVSPDAQNRYLRTGIKKAGITGESRPVDKNENSKANSLKELLHGFEPLILDPVPMILVDHLRLSGGFDPYDVWTACCQTRMRVQDKTKDKINNPAGYFVHLLTDRKHTLSDSARKKAKKEMQDNDYWNLG